MQVGAEFLHERTEAGLRRNRKVLEVERDPLVIVSCEKGRDLPTEICASIGAVEKVSDRGKPLLRDRIEVVHQREDLDVCLFSFDQRHYLLIHDAHISIRLNYVENGVGRVYPLKVAVWREHVQPFREEQVDLMQVIAERRITAGVPHNIECGADGFFVQYHFRGSFSAVAMGAAPQCATTIALLDWTIAMLRAGKQQLRYGLTAYRRKEKHRDDQRDYNAHNVKHTTESPP